MGRSNEKNIRYSPDSPYEFNLEDLIGLIKAKGYHLYTKPFKLNIVGIRNRKAKINLFNEVIIVFYKDSSGCWVVEQFEATTRPGLYWLQKLINPRGTAVLMEGQYIETYKLDLHRGKYTALCQGLKPVRVLRDYNKNDTIDYDTGRKENGFFGINLHRASAWKILKHVGRNSAGCQVICNPKLFKERLIKLCKSHKDKHGNKFTYTLLRLSELQAHNCLLKKRIEKQNILTRFFSIKLLGDKKC